MNKPALLDETRLEAVRRRFGVALQRRDTLRLIQLFGCTIGTARLMIEGVHAPLKPLSPRPGCKRRQWSREVIISELNVTQ